MRLITKIGVASLLIILVILIFKFFFIVFPECIYTESELVIPDELKGKDIILEHDAYLAKGIDKTYNECTPILLSVENNIIGSGPINSITIGKEYFERQGLVISEFKKGSIFRLERIISVKKHGFSTIDSGSGPIYYLILNNSDGINYKVATIDLPTFSDKIEFDEVVLKYNIDESREDHLSWEYFQDYYEPDFS